MPLSRRTLCLLAAHFLLTVAVGGYVQWFFDAWFAGGVSHPHSLIAAVVLSHVLLVLAFPLGYAAPLVAAKFTWTAGLCCVFLNSLLWVWIGYSIRSACWQESSAEQQTAT